MPDIHYSKLFELPGFHKPGTKARYEVFNDSLRPGFKRQFKGTLREETPNTTQKTH